jgi:hypothetical protein
MVKLEKVITDDVTKHYQDFISEYTAEHSTPGREGTTLKETIKVRHSRMCKNDERVTASITIEAKRGNEEDALDKLAEYLERMAIAIRTRGVPQVVASDYRNPKNLNEYLP